MSVNLRDMLKLLIFDLKLPIITGDANYGNNVKIKNFKN
jgi:hypothetical protein